MSNSTSPKPPISSDSAPPVYPRFQFALNGEGIQDTDTKCGQCKTVTSHQWLMIKVADRDNTMDLLELAGLARRLILCTNCGNLRLIK